MCGGAVPRAPPNGKGAGRLPHPMEGGIPLSMTDEVCAHVVAADFASLDDFTVSRIKTRVLDAVGVIAAGVHAPLCDELFDLLKSYGTTPQSAAFFRGERIDAPQAAMINSFCMRSYDFEAIEAENPGRKSSAAHISGTTVPTALRLRRARARERPRLRHGAGPGRRHRRPPGRGFGLRRVWRLGQHQHHQRAGRHRHCRQARQARRASAQQRPGPGSQHAGRIHGQHQLQDARLQASHGARVAQRHLLVRLRGAGHDGHARRLRRQEGLLLPVLRRQAAPGASVPGSGQGVLRRRGDQAVVGLPRHASLHRRRHADRGRPRHRPGGGCPRDRPRHAAHGPGLRGPAVRDGRRPPGERCLQHHIHRSGGHSLPVACAPST